MNSSDFNNCLPRVVLHTLAHDLPRDARHPPDAMIIRIYIYIYIYMYTCIYIYIYVYDI